MVQDRDLSTSPGLLSISRATPASPATAVSSADDADQRQCRQTGCIWLRDGVRAKLIVANNIGGGQSRVVNSKFIEHTVEYRIGAILRTAEPYAGVGH